MLPESKAARVHWWMTLAFFVVVSGFVAACTPGISPTVPASSTIAPPDTVSTTTPLPAGPSRPTLPATWTLTPSFTPLPPSATPTLTLTPSITPTYSAADHCAAFVLLSYPALNAQLTGKFHSNVTFIWEYPLYDGVSALHLSRAGSRFARMLTIPGPQPVVAVIPFGALYGPGVYRWELGPVTADGQWLADCTLSGSFTIALRAREDWRWPQPIPLVESSAAADELR